MPKAHKKLERLEQELQTLEQKGKEKGFKLNPRVLSDDEQSEEDSALAVQEGRGLEERVHKVIRTYEQRQSFNEEWKAKQLDKLYSVYGPYYKEK